MSSELVIVKGYSRFWDELLTGATVYINHINQDKSASLFEPLELEDIPERRSLINNIAFSLFKRVCQKEMDTGVIPQLTLTHPLLSRVFQEELQKTAGSIRSSRYDEEIIDNELIIIKEMTQRMITTFGHKKGMKVYPAFEGCGFVHAAQGDIYYLDTLVEVKAGDRNFRSQDIRQLLVYGALNIKQDAPYDIKYFQLFNPRTGQNWIEQVDIVTLKIAACSSMEVYNTLIQLMSSEYQSL